MKKVAVIGLVVCAFAGTAFLACDGDDPDAGQENGDASSNADSVAPPPDGAIGDAGLAVCDQYAEAVCNRMQRCSPLLIDIAMGSLEACKEGTKIICERTTKAPGAAPLLASCIDVLNTGCGDTFPAPTECTGKGTLIDGTTCEFDSQCASGRCGSGGNVPGCGVCKPASDAAPYTSEGGSCNNEGRCAPGLSCIDAGTGTAGEPISGTCGKTRALGEACKDAEDCNTGSYGDFGWMSFTVACLEGSCAKPLDENATCSPSIQAQHSCDVQKKLRCELLVDGGALSGRCSKWPFAKTNEACTKNNQTASGTCYGDQLCVGDGGSGTSGTCVPKGSTGATCARDFDCRFGLSCVNGACAIPPPDRCK